MSGFEMASGEQLADQSADRAEQERQRVENAGDQDDRRARTAPPVWNDSSRPA